MGVRDKLILLWLQAMLEERLASDRSLRGIDTKMVGALLLQPKKVRQRMTGARKHGRCVTQEYDIRDQHSPTA